MKNKKFFNFVKGFFNFVKNNALLIFAAFFMLDFVIGIFTSYPVDPIERKIKCINRSIDILWVFSFLEAYVTTKIEKQLYKCIKLVDDKVDLICDFLQKVIEEEESEEESADKEEKEVNLQNKVNSKKVKIIDVL